MVWTLKSIGKIYNTYTQVSCFDRSEFPANDESLLSQLRQVINVDYIEFGALISNYHQQGYYKKTEELYAAVMRIQGEPYAYLLILEKDGNGNRGCRGYSYSNSEDNTIIELLYDNHGATGVEVPLNSYLRGYMLSLGSTYILDTPLKMKWAQQNNNAMLQLLTSKYQELSNTYQNLSISNYVFSKDGEYVGCLRGYDSSWRNVCILIYGSDANTYKSTYVETQYSGDVDYMFNSTNYEHVSIGGLSYDEYLDAHNGGGGGTFDFNTVDQQLSMINNSSNAVSYLSSIQNSGNNLFNYVRQNGTQGAYPDYYDLYSGPMRYHVEGDGTNYLAVYVENMNYSWMVLFSDQTNYTWVAK